MNEMASKLQAVINTLEGLEIQSKKDTMLKLLGCMQMLTEIKDQLNEQAVEVANGDDHAE